MSCLSLNIVCIRQAAIAVTTATMAAVGVQPTVGATLSVQSGARMALSPIHASAATLAVAPTKHATLKATLVPQDEGQTPGPRPSTARLAVTPIVGTSLAAHPLPQANVSVQTGRTVAASVATLLQTALAVTPASLASLSVAATPAAQLHIAEVCSIGGGELFVLATQEGPLRTQDGGFLLLAPDTD